MAKADLALINGNIYVIDESNSIVQAVACKNGRIIFVGGTDEIRSFIGPHTQVIDLEGNTVLPGLIDSHVHVPGNAFNVLYCQRR